MANIKIPAATCAAEGGASCGVPNPRLTIERRRG
jgi:hypothetical protein